MKPDPYNLVSRIRESEIFKDIPEEQLLWLVNMSEYLHLKKGDSLFKTGDKFDKLYVFLKGRILFQQQQNGGFRTLNEVHAGEVTGALPYSRAKIAIANAQVEEDLEALYLHSGHFKEMILNHYELTEALVHIMTSRVREFTRNQQQSEKMAALGKLSAGLAHELNNPASAVVRSSANLKKLLKSVPESFEQLMASCPDPQIFQKLQELTILKPQEPEDAPTDRQSALSLLEKSELVDQQAEWLSGHGVKNAYEVAEAFSDSGISLSNLQDLEKEQNLEREQLGATLQWLSKLLAMGKLTDEIQQSSKRISELVNAVKTYSHMDRSPEKENIDLRKGIEDTLTMLNFKIRKKNIKIRKNYPEDLPEVCVYAGALNQLWTNLLDNSIDALEEGGEISISLSYSDEDIKVAIQDNGDGIPQEIREKIFDPFFTTKELGKGSGMGLEIAKNIVEDHEGSISLDSEPGKTVFTISIPR